MRQNSFFYLTCYFSLFKLDLIWIGARNFVPTISSSPQPKICLLKMSLNLEIMLLFCGWEEGKYKYQINRRCFNSKGKLKQMYILLLLYTPIYDKMFSWSLNLKQCWVSKSLIVVRKKLRVQNFWHHFNRDQATFTSHDLILMPLTHILKKNSRPICLVCLDKLYCEVLGCFLSFYSFFAKILIEKFMLLCCMFHMNHFSTWLIFILNNRTVHSNTEFFLFL